MKFLIVFITMCFLGGCTDRRVNELSDNDNMVMCNPVTGKAYTAEAAGVSSNASLIKRAPLYNWMCAGYTPQTVPTAPQQ